MTLIVDNPNPNHDASTHVFVVGIGAYKHFRGGSDPKRITDVPRLGQLSSPPISARAFTKWVCEELDNPDAPLGSVELLLSEANGNSTYTVKNQQPQVIEEANSVAIFTAFSEWYERCNDNPDNVALFYYSGHGLEKANLILLPCDFNEVHTSPWRNTIDFEMTRLAMQQNRAKTQCYFIDACRETTKQMLNEYAVRGDPLKIPVPGQQNTSQLTQPVLYATSSGNKAFGKPDDLTFYTKALLEALRGKGASQQDNNKWCVDTDGLLKAVIQLVNVDNKKRKKKEHQDVKGGGQVGQPSIIHHIVGVPPVDATVVCNPIDVTDIATFTVKEPLSGKTYQRQPAAGAWEVTVDAGAYVVSATFAGNQFSSEPVSRFMIPPVATTKLEVT